MLFFSGQTSKLNEQGGPRGGHRRRGPVRDLPGEPRVFKHFNPILPQFVFLAESGCDDGLPL